ncbi:MAG TPA: DNA/RNA non-specific endonuclease [Prolixibacteraceae bacterium]|nr:DNA/RNA non-specific endonuclease [Prolixibacteraceae bacterium]
MKLLQLVFLLLAANISVAYSNDFIPVPETNVIRHSWFTLSYNEANEQANWVYYSLTDQMVRKSGAERSSSFKVDVKVPGKSAKSSNYSRSGYDRGHLCPAADMDFDPVAMKESFLMSNVSPQDPEFNRGIWKILEETVREWAIQEKQLYIVTGPVFQNNKGVIGEEEVLVPGYFFKVIYDPTDQPKMIAFVMPNQASDQPLTDFTVPVDEAERLTGFDFFSQLPDNQEAKLESRALLAGWFDGYAPDTIPEPEAEVTPEKAPEAKPKAPEATPEKKIEKEVKKDAPVNINLVLIILIILIVIVILILIFTFNSNKKR